MEEFGKHIYKNEFQTKNEKEVNIEKIEQSEKVAKAKLEKIMKKQFRDYAVRFMSIEEYKELIETGNLSGEFTLSDNFHSNYDFSEFVTSFSNVDDANDQLRNTMWEEMSGITALETGNIIDQIKHIETDNKDKTLEEKRGLIKDYIFQYLDSHKHGVRRYLRGVRFSSNWTGNALDYVNDYKNPEILLKDIDFIPEEDKSNLQEEFLGHISKNVKYGARYHGASLPYIDWTQEKAKKYNLDKEQTEKLRKYFRSVEIELNLGKKNLEVIEDFKNDPYFLNKKDGLREIVTALGNIHNWVTQDQHRQYHLALVVDKNIVFGKHTSSSWGNDAWRELYSEEGTDKEKVKSSVLAAISIYPLKEMYKEISDIERDSGDVAHPVFDNKGIVRWPKDK